MIEIFDTFFFSIFISFFTGNVNFSIIGIILFYTYLILVFFVLGVFLVLSRYSFRFYNLNEKMGQILLNIGLIEFIWPIPPFIFGCFLFFFLMFIFDKIQLEFLMRKYKTARFIVSLGPFLAFFNITLCIYLYQAPISDFSLICAYLFFFFSLVGVFSYLIIFFIYIYDKNGP